MKRGILIQALGHNNYYRMAVVLAASIKANEEISICLITDNVIQPEHEKLFDIVKPPTFKSITHKGKTMYIKSKLYMYEQSPFDETIFLDADQIVISGKSLLSVFEQLKNIDFTMSNTGIANTTIWCDINEIKQLYSNKPFWNYHSEFVYFKKNKSIKQYFDTAKKVFEDNKIASAIKFAESNMADELAFQCASIITGIYPHKKNWTPNFWYDRYDAKEAMKYPYELQNFITYSIGGTSVPNRVKNNYNILANHYFATLGLSNPYQVIDKRNFLPERKKV